MVLALSDSTPTKIREMTQRTLLSPLAVPAWLTLAHLATRELKQR
jgi:hypothetical protein